MNNWLQWLGFDRESIPDDAEVSFRFANLPESWGVFVFVAALVLMVWFVLRTYRRENDACPRWAKHLLATLRLLVGAALVFIFLEPSVTYTKTRALRPVLALLRDTSESMNTTDRYEDEAAAKAAAEVLGTTVADLRSKRPSRVEIANAMFERDDKALVKALAEKGRLRVLDFSERVSEADSPDSGGGGEPAGAQPSEDTVVKAEADLPPLAAGGSGTDIARAIREALAERLTSAVVVLTDGQHNTSGDLDAAVAEARTRKVPVFFVGLGDPDRPQNLSVSNLYADPQVWNNDPFQIQAVLRSEGFGGETVQVELVEIIGEPGDDGADPEEKVLESKDVELPAAGGQVRLDFSYTPVTPGAKRYTVRAAALDDESNTEDNAPTAPARVEVLDDNARVLMISGGPSWEYRALARLFTREKMIDVSCWLQTLESGRLQQGNTPIDRLPTTREALFEYDVVLMLDPDPIDFDEEWVGLLEKFVREHSGGLLYMPGPVFAGRFLTGSRTSGIQDMLPVRLGDVGGMEVDSLLATNNREWPLAIVSANTDHPIMRFFADSGQTLMQWKKLPGTYWSFPALSPKPAARTLIEHSDPTLRRREVARPLLVTGQAGTGRTVYLGFDGTWRWRTKGLDAEFFKRYWIQTTRYLVEGRSLAGKRRGVVETERFRYGVGDRVRMTARLKGQDFAPLESDAVEAALILPDGGTAKLDFRPLDGQPGTYETVFAAAQQGGHRVAITLPGEGAETIDIDTNFTVTLPLKEVQQAWLDQPRLTGLARVAGGSYFDPAAAAGLAAALPDRVRNLESESPPLPVWDNRLLLFLLAGLLTVEWALRKKFKLI